MIKKFLKEKKGFTMIELLMVLAIFTVLTLVVMYKYSEFNSSTIMSNMAYEAALAVRQAQVYSLGVRGISGNNDFEKRYGVYFNTQTNNKDFILFMDGKLNNSNLNGLCDGSDSNVNCGACVNDECMEKNSLNRDIYFERVCVSESLDPIDKSTGECTDPAPVVNEVSITFDRPNPDSLVNNERYKNVGIVLKNSFGNQRGIIVRNTGQISVIMINSSN